MYWNEMPWFQRLLIVSCSGFAANAFASFIEWLCTFYFKQSTPMAPLVTGIACAVNLASWLDEPLRKHLTRELLIMTLVLLVAFQLTMFGIAVCLRLGFPLWVGASPGTGLALWGILPFREKAKAVLKRDQGSVTASERNS